MQYANRIINKNRNNKGDNKQSSIRIEDENKIELNDKISYCKNEKI